MQTLANILFSVFLVGSFLNPIANQGFQKHTISGIIKSKSGQPVEFATLYNLNKKTSSISNSQGEYVLEAKVGDSVRIQHLNFETQTIQVKNGIQNVLLAEKKFMINEVQVTPKAAFELFNKSCENTWKSFKENNLTTAYCKCILKNGLVVSKTADLDLDIVQKKQKNYKHGEKTSVYKIQERIISDSTDWQKQFAYSLKLFYPPIQDIYWVQLPNQFNYYKTEDKNLIKLYLLSKTSYDHSCKIEVIIGKRDTVLHSFGMLKKDIPVRILTTRNVIGHPTIVEDTIVVPRTYHYIEYKYTNGFGYLSEYVQGAIVQPQSVIEFSEHLKVYNNGAEILQKRRNRRKLFRNSFSFKLLKNRFENQFWNDLNYPIHFPYNFEQLEKLNFGTKATEIIPKPE